MKVKMLRSYRSKNGNVTFVYTVSGSAEQLAAFKEAQGEFYREDESGKPLWFTTRFIGDNGTLVLTTNGNIVPDMSALDKAESLVKQYGGNLGQELAKAAAQQFMGKGTSNAPAAPEPPADDLDKL